MTGPVTPRIGAHISLGGQPGRALTAATGDGCESVQVFASNPRGWAHPSNDRGQATMLREAAAQQHVPLLVHAPYLINLGSPDETTWERSRSLLTATMSWSAAAGAQGVVLHPGSHLGSGVAAGQARLRAAVLPLLEETDGPELLLEPAAGTRNALASTPAETAALLDAVDRHPRAGVCLDTAHAHAAGHDLSTPDSARMFLDELVAAVGAGRLRAVHANDSKVAAGANRDRHEHIGRGTIGDTGFAALLAHPALAGLPVVVETPGTDTDRANDVAHLRRLRDQGTPAPR